MCRQILSRHGILIGGHVLSVGPAEDRRFNMADIEPEILKSLSREYFPVLFPSIRQEMRRQIEEARLALDSLGGGGGMRCDRIADRDGKPHVRREWRI